MPARTAGCKLFYWSETVELPTRKYMTSSNVLAPTATTPFRFNNKGKAKQASGYQLFTNMSSILLDAGAAERIHRLPSSVTLHIGSAILPSMCRSPSDRVSVACR